DGGRRSLHPGCHRNPAEPDQASARTSAGVRADFVAREQPAVDGLLLADEGVLRFLRRARIGGHTNAALHCFFGYWPCVRSRRVYVTEMILSVLEGRDTDGRHTA